MTMDYHMTMDCHMTMDYHMTMGFYMTMDYHMISVLHIAAHKQHTRMININKFKHYLTTFHVV